MATRKELVNVVSEKTNVAKADVTIVMSAVFEAISEWAKEAEVGDTLTMHGTGLFRKCAQKARTARNPMSGETVEVPEKECLRFRASGTLRKYFTDKAK